MSLIELTNIHKTYRDESTTPVLHGVDLTIDAGEFVALMGASGSGKTTLMNVIGLLDQPSSGKYLLDGRLIEGMRDKDLARLRRKTVGFVFQSFNLLPRLSVLDNVALPMIYDHLRLGARRKRAKKLLTEVGLSNRLNFRPPQLSGGERQRVAIARALANHPTIILADEPTGNLDSKTGDQVMQLLIGLNQQGNTVIVVTHDHHVASFTKRIINLVDGKVVK